MFIDTATLERYIRLVAIASGMLAISLPLLRLWLRRGTTLAGSIGNRISFTRWPAVFILTMLYLAIGILLWKPIPLYMSPLLQISLAVTGSMIYFPGIILYLWSFKTLGLMYGVSTISGAQLYEQHQIIESGPYSFVRHPMYLGVMLAAIGALLIFRTWAMVIFTPSAFVVILRARREEQLMAREFGPSWADYCRRVPAWMPRSLHGNTKTDEQVDH
jgi:protein-S-isoprenylcysteine O-methyltransferase Ste14